MAAVLNSCFGEFQLVRKVYTWNSELMDKDTLMGRFVNNLVFIALNVIPVYGIAGAVDFWILNLVEFWTGSNPLAMAEGEIEQQRIFKDGREFMITATKNQFHIQEIGVAENEMTLNFDSDALAWDVTTPSTSFRLADMHADGSLAHVYTEDGNTLALK
jgi:hypothetical protein